MSDLKLQRDFFDVEDNQYSTDLILNSPLHTKLEIKAIIAKLESVSKNGAIMDFGAGSGRLTIPLLENRFSVYSVDISMNSLLNLKKLAKEYTTRLKIYAKIPDKIQFQAIVGADILHHIDMDEYLPIFYKSLANGRRIIFSEPGAFNLSWYIYLPLFYDWKVEKGFINCSYFNLKNKLQKYGYKNIKITGLGILPRPFLNLSKKLCQLNDSLGNFPIFKLFAYRYIIEATK